MDFLRKLQRDSESSATDGLKLKEKKGGGVVFLHGINIERIIVLTSSSAKAELRQHEKKKKKCPEKILQKHSHVKLR